MSYKYKLSDALIGDAVALREFAIGAAQVTIELKDERIFEKGLVSNSQAIIALRGYSDLPFLVNEIAKIYQIEADINPRQRDGWKFWDQWQ